MLLGLNMFTQTQFIDAWITRTVLGIGSAPVPLAPEAGGGSEKASALLMGRCETVPAPGRLPSTVGNPD